MRYIVLGAVAAAALAVTAGPALAQHGGHGGHGYPAYSPTYSGHGFTGHYAPGHHPSGGHIVHPGGGFYAGSSYGGGFGVGVVPGPSYYPAYPGIGYGHGRGQYSHHGRHH